MQNIVSLSAIVKNIQVSWNPRSNEGEGTAQTNIQWLYLLDRQQHVLVYPRTP